MAYREINPDGIKLVMRFEGCPDGDPSTVNLDPYLDPVDIWTIGWGHVVYYNGRRLEGAIDEALAHALYPTGITSKQAESLLAVDLLDAGRDVERLVKVKLTDNQFAALASFTFNLGANNLAKSTLLRELNEGDYSAAAGQFGRWVLAKGVKQAGLVLRRQAERDLFCTT
ncbi:lysozyme [Herbaspirillum sp. HC18]|nr:lysozyme [Herbaspirillum sp. HC18]